MQPQQLYSNPNDSKLYFTETCMKDRGQALKKLKKKQKLHADWILNPDSAFCILWKKQLCVLILFFFPRCNWHRQLSYKSYKSCAACCPVSTSYISLITFNAVIPDCCGDIREVIRLEDVCSHVLEHFIWHIHFQCPIKRKTKHLAHFIHFKPKKRREAFIQRSIITFVLKLWSYLKPGIDISPFIPWTVFFDELWWLNFWMDVLYSTRHLSLISLLSVRIEACRLLNYLSIQCHLFVPQVGVTRAWNQSLLKWINETLIKNATLLWMGVREEGWSVPDLILFPNHMMHSDN